MTFKVHPRGSENEFVAVWKWSGGDGCVLAISDPGSGVDATRLTGPGTQSGTLYLPETLRRVAAVLVALADEAEKEPEPDPDMVEELAAVLHRTRCTSSGYCLLPTISDLDEARTAIRWMKQREASS